MKKTCKSIKDCPDEKPLFMNKNGHEIFECTTCGHRFHRVADFKIHLEKVYSDSYFFEGKSGYPNYLDEKEILIKHGNRYAKLMSKYIDKPGKVLDVGSAAGFILKGFENEGWTCYGVEPNKTMAEYGKDEFGFDIQVGDLESYETNQKFDLITLIEVIGHFNDLDIALQKAHSFLRPNGIILVESWNRESLIVKLIGKHWHAYCPSSVVHWFSDKTITELFDFYGFDRLKKGFPFKQIKLKHGIALIDTNTPNFFLKQRIIKLLTNSFGKLKLIYPPIDVKWYVFQKRN